MAQRLRIYERLGFMKVVVLRLQALLQSYGDKSIFTETRDTNDMPTKSAVVGMIAGAMGIQREDYDTLDELNDHLEIYAKRNGGTVRKMSDMQMIRGESFPVASGSRKPAMPIVTKEYLVGADFNVYVVTNNERADAIAAAMQHPVYPTVLGRKCCSPATRVFQCVMEEMSEKEKSECICL